MENTDHPPGNPPVPSTHTAIHFTAIHRVTHAEERLREAHFWATRSIPERVIAGWNLADDTLIRRDPHEPEKRAALTLRRVVRRRR